MGPVTVAGCSLRHLRVFQEVARLKSVRKAADAVHLTQPAVTQAIAKLESQIGTALFERRSSGTYLTPAGTTLSCRVRSMFEQIEAALARLSAAREARPPISAMMERITRAQIRALAAISNGHVAAAAEQAGISQASLLHAARELERHLGARVLCHGPGGLSVTESGRDLAQELSIALREIEFGLEEIWADAERCCGLIRVGAMPLAGSFLLGPVLNDLSRSYPDAQIQVRTADGTYLSGALLRGEVDFVIGLCGWGDGKKVVEQALVMLPYVLVARRDHPLTRQVSITLADLERYELIAPGRSATRRVAFDRLLASFEHAPSANIEASSLSTLRTLLQGSDRLALLTRFEFEHEQVTGALAALPFGPIEPAASLGVTLRSDCKLPPLHRRFLELLRTHAAAISGQHPETAAVLQADGVG